MGGPAEHCDVLIEAGWVVPVVPKGVVLEDHAVAVRGDVIVAIGPRAGMRERFAAGEVVSRPGSVLIPGLVNAHTHNPMTLLRGIADDLPLMEWLQGHIWPVEGAVTGPEFVRDGVTLAIAEMLRGGTTCANENYFFPDVQAETYKRYGFRALVGLPIIDFSTAWARTSDEYFAKAADVDDAWRGDELIGTTIAPHAPYTVCDANFERVRDFAHERDVRVHLHLHETAQEVRDSVAQHGMRPLARLDRLGLVDDRLIGVHMTQLTDDEIALCAERRVCVAHCPESNLKLASGFCPVCKLQHAGVDFGIGTDGCASNNDLDMVGETRTAALLAKAVADDASALDAASALHSATLGGAITLGLGGRIGSIEGGKQADLTCIDLDGLESQPLHHVISQLVYATARHQVTDVWIAGRAKLRARVLVDMDIDAIIANARQWRGRIAAIRTAP
ncbi:TRZ/ATZ family hydrolase [Cognatilysobacter lacus]|uniref:TRZ/ATZ family hydrolase n=1 Tax=Cognatilysobacter lacus TaxID=1643323 RepID=A0A5D8Z8F3_9GAMM|nr:TRZ/ATZ family hydrolase [Lysobacter lacus]TZF91109.1 TRZ/ATZ family hydrolase [Lysobacter lacus]